MCGKSLVACAAINAGGPASTRNTHVYTRAHLRDFPGNQPTTGACFRHRRRYPYAITLSRPNPPTLDLLIVFDAGRFQANTDTTASVFWSAV